MVLLIICVDDNDKSIRKLRQRLNIVQGHMTISKLVPGLNKRILCSARNPCL